MKAERCVQDGMPTFMEPCSLMFIASNAMAAYGYDKVLPGNVS